MKRLEQSLTRVCVCVQVWAGGCAEPGDELETREHHSERERGAARRNGMEKRRVVRESEREQVGTLSKKKKERRLGWDDKTRDRGCYCCC